ncbi:unnamed protein product [Dicrocoelium dendriticum]|nr:unnamed protein product [Dicrocoelium dendriticum]
MKEMSAIYECSPQFGYNAEGKDGLITCQISQRVKAHACLMLMAWGFCCPNGMLAVRHFKLAWPGRTFRHWKYWFNLHLGFQASLVALVVIGLMTMVVHLADYSKLKTFPFAAHPLLGFVTFTLTVSNPFISWFVITSTERRRAVLRSVHQYVGLASHLLAVVCIFIGFSLPKMSQGRCFSTLFSSMYMTTVVIYAVTEIALEFIGYAILGKIKVLERKFQPLSLDAGVMLNQVFEVSRHKKQKLLELLPEKNTEDTVVVQKYVRSIHAMNALRITKVAYWIYTWLSFWDKFTFFHAKPSQK